MYERVCRMVNDMPWAILPSTLDTIVSVLRARVHGERLTPAELSERISARRVPATVSAALVGDIAVMPLYGVVTQRANLFADMSGGTSTDRFAAEFRRLVESPDVGMILLDVDSPGGGVYGVPELADEIFAARQKKLIVAQVNSLAASAAYWLATQATEMVLTPSGEVGSIGVRAVHEDWSEASKKAGVRVTYVSAGRYKTEGHQYAPLDDPARGYLQSRVDDYYRDFVRAVARGRRRSQQDVRDGFGEGRMVGADDAMRWGMVDRVATLDQTLTRYQSGRPRVADAKAATTEDRLRHAALAELDRRRRRLAVLEREGAAAILPTPDPKPLPSPSPPAVVPASPVVEGPWPATRLTS